MTNPAIMNRNADTPGAITATPAEDDVASAHGAGATEDTPAPSDPTLKWIVTDAVDPSKQEPAPTSMVANGEATLPPVPQEPLADRTPIPSPADPAAGATPAGFLAVDSGSASASIGPAPEYRGAAPVSIISESADSAGTLPEVTIEESSSAEPHEVEVEVFDETESAQNAVAINSPDHILDELQRPTPPPIPVEAALPTPPPVPPEATATMSRAAPAPKTTGEAAASPPPVAIAAALFENPPLSIPEGEPLPEALARRSLVKRSKPWYEEVFDEDYLRTLPFMTAEQTAREVQFIRDALSPPEGGEVLDVGCGYGRHALDLASQGLRVTGLDLSLPLLIRAADHAQKRGLSVNFVHADMREMTYSGQFDAAYCMLSSFGYFDEETNLRVATAICKSLKPGGRFLLDIINRDYIVRDLPSRVWWEGDGCVVLEEVDFNYHTSRVLIRRSVVFGNGRQVEQDLSVRAYSLHELGKLLRQAGVRVLDVSGGLGTKSRFFGAASRNIIAVCERPPT